MTSQTTMGTFLSNRLDITIKGIKYHTSNDEFYFEQYNCQGHHFQRKTIFN